MFFLFIMLTAAGFHLTYIGAHEPNNIGAMWEGGLFCGFALSAFFAALTAKAK